MTIQSTVISTIVLLLACSLTRTCPTPAVVPVAPTLKPTSTIIATATSSPTPIPTRTNLPPTPTQLASPIPTNTFTPSPTIIKTSTPKPTAISTPIMTPELPVMAIVNEAVNGRICPSESGECPIVAVLFPGTMLVLAEGKQGDWQSFWYEAHIIWIWFQHDPGKARQAVEVIGE